MSETELRVSKIKDGTVIDHITDGHAFDVFIVYARAVYDFSLLSSVMFIFIG
jgi:aspartate carbamoyltransferase regulatory subunit